MDQGALSMQVELDWGKGTRVFFVSESSDCDVWHGVGVGRRLGTIAQNRSTITLRTTRKVVVPLGQVLIKTSVR
jgi:hypothetical protein